MAGIDIDKLLGIDPDFQFVIVDKKGNDQSSLRWYQSTIDKTGAVSGNVAP